MATNSVPGGSSTTMSLGVSAVSGTGVVDTTPPFITDINIGANSVVFEYSEDLTYKPNAQRGGILLNGAGFNIANNGSLAGNILTVTTSVPIAPTDWLLMITGSDFMDAAGNATIAGMTGAFGGSGDDAIDLSASVTPVWIGGFAGNDILTGGAGDDQMDGGDGDDTVHGGGGNDYLHSNSLGVAGNDSLFGDAGNDTIFIAGTSGTNETVLVDGGAGDDLIQIVLSQIYGNRTLTATGGSGIDTYQFGAYQFLAGDTIASFTVTDFTAGVGGDRIDVTALLTFYSLGYTGGDPFSVTNGYLRLVQSGTDTLLQYDEDGAAGTAYTFHTAIALQGVTATAITSDNFAGSLNPTGVTLDGGAGNDTLTGGTGGDIMNGGAGDDILTGGAGDDTLSGGAGADTFNVDAGTDTLADAVPGTDVINISSGATALQNLTMASVSYATNTTNSGTLVVNALSSTASEITGSSGIDIITGSSAGDILAGGTNNDTLNGGAGNDAMEGGAGDDTYYVDSTGDSVVETGNVSSSATRFRLALSLDSNIDKVIASVNYTLGSYLENLDLAAGSGSLTGAGNALNNVLTGNEGDNTLTGGAGNDSLDGSTGIDVAAYTGSHSSFTISQSGTSFTITDSTGSEGTDTVTNIERLTFADTNIALDITGGNAGTTAKILGAVFGQASVSYTDYVGIGLGYLDGGMSYQDLMLLALNARLGAGFTNADEVNLLYQNLVGALPSAADLSYWTGVVTSGQYTQTSLATMAADHSLNTANINLVGLAQTGIEFV